MNAPSFTPPRQARSRRTLEAIVEAAFALLEEEGPEALTVHAVTERAGASVGSFYARFRGKADLLEHLRERAWRETVGAWAAALAARDLPSCDPADALQAAVELLSGPGGAPARALDALGEAGSAGEEGSDGTDLRAAFHERSIEDLARALLGRPGAFSHPDPELAVRVGLRAVAGLFGDSDRERPAGGPNRPPGSPPDGDPSEAGAPDIAIVDPATLRREAIRLLRAYLFARPRVAAPGVEPEAVDFFDVWG